MKDKIKIALVDDHTLFRKGLGNLIHELDPNHQVVWEANDGKECLARLASFGVPDILIMDVSMPVMDGYELAEALRISHPAVPILVVSMIDKEEALIKMLRLGIRGYLSKDIEPEELLKAIVSVLNKGYYYTDHITGKLIKAMQDGQEKQAEIILSDREKQLLTLVCSDDTYKEIADKMFLSPKTVDTYRMSLFEKLQVKSRTGLVLYAIRTGWVKI
jgi:two-component system invasion response regulator UvrY